MKISKTDLNRLARLEARRPADTEAEAAAALAQVKAEIARMAARARAAPGWIEPPPATPERIAELRAKIERCIRPGAGG
jgi:hypothetical protein